MKIKVKKLIYKYIKNQNIHNFCLFSIFIFTLHLGVHYCQFIFDLMKLLNYMINNINVNVNYRLILKKNYNSNLFICLIHTIIL